LSVLGCQLLVLIESTNDQAKTTNLLLPAAVPLEHGLGDLGAAGPLSAPPPGVDLVFG
jgi:hypothetical protein